MSSKRKLSEMLKAVEEFEEPFQASDGAILVDMSDMAAKIVRGFSEEGLPERLRAFEEVGQLWAGLRVDYLVEVDGSDVLFGVWSETDLGEFRAKISLGAVLDDLLDDPADIIGGHPEDEWAEVKADYEALAALLAKYAQIAADRLEGIDGRLAESGAKRRKDAAALAALEEAMRRSSEALVKAGTREGRTPKKKAKAKRKKL
jgi:hypothetical protein